jgi:hypothetical protein
MRLRDASILIGMLCLGTVAGVTFFAGDTFAVELPPGTERGGDAGAEARTANVDGGQSAPLTAPGTDAPGADAAPLSADVSSNKPRVDTSGWTSGTVRGDIQLATSVLDRLGSITVVVEEARGAFGDDGQFQRPHRMLAAVERGRGTPTFEVTGIPFSSHPYVVSVHTAGLNGSRRTVVIDETNPLVQDIVLTITPGAPFSVLVRDQDASPWHEVEVRMIPVGDPPGRSRHNGTTDNFGSVVFDGVLAGEYELSTFERGQPLGQPTRVSVQPGNYSGPLHGQATTLLIPRGVAVQMVVHDAAGYGVHGAKVTATATDRTKLTTAETTTDVVGRAEFPHLQPGTWQITIECDKFQRVDQQLTVQAGQEPVYREIKLVRTRW